MGGVTERSKSAMTETFYGWNVLFGERIGSDDFAVPPTLLVRASLSGKLPSLYEPWMRHADRLLEDDEVLAIAWEALGRRHRKSRQHSRPATPAEVVLRLLILKHVRHWSFAVLEREVRANALYRHFARIGWEAVPDAKTLARIARALGPAVIAKLHERLSAMARRLAQLKARTKVATAKVTRNAKTRGIRAPMAVHLPLRVSLQMVRMVVAHGL